MRLAAISLLSLLPLLGQAEKAPPEKATKAPLPPPTNLKVLKVSTGPEVGQIMRTFTTGIGVQCVYCHVQGNFASDENPKKEIARHMISMTQQINGNFSEGKLRVSCYTCHRGEPEPKTAPEPKAAQ